MSFESDIRAHMSRRDRRLQAIFRESVIELKQSVVVGSKLTGAPGQPVDTGRLRGSWIDRFLAPWRWLITTALVYAPIVENLPETSIRSEVGGARSVAKSRTGWQRIVNHVAARHPA